MGAGGRPGRVRHPGPFGFPESTDGYVGVSGVLHIPGERVRDQFIASGVRPVPEGPGEAVAAYVPQDQDRLPLGDGDAAPEGYGGGPPQRTTPSMWASPPSKET